MVFSNTTSKAGIIQQIEQITNIGDANISGVTVKMAYFTNLINNWLHIVTHWIQEVDGEWSYDDANHGNFPEETFAFVDNQQDYGLTSTGESDSLVVRKVEIQDVTTNDWTQLEFCLQENIPESYNTVDKNKPSKYWLSGGSIVFDCPVDTTKTDNFRVTYDRNAHIFVVGDTTAVPGFDTKFHMILAYGPSMEWALETGNQGTAEKCRRMIFGTDTRIDIGLKGMLQQFYSHRAAEAPPGVGRRQISWK